MIYKNLLTSQANEVSQLLNEHIISHNKMLQLAGTIKSQFENVDFSTIHKEINKVETNFEQKAYKLKEIKEEHYENFTDVSMEFFDALENYFNSLFEAVKQESLLSFRLYETSKGFIGNKRKLSWSEYSQLTKGYDEKVKVYSELGDKLNLAYQKFEHEPNDLKDYEAEEVKTSNILRIVESTNIKINPLDGQPLFYFFSSLLCIFIFLAVLLNGLLSIVFWILVMLSGFIIFSIIYVRLSAKWRRVHYPLMTRYAKARGGIQVQHEDLANNEKMDIALLFLLKSVYPTITQNNLQLYLNDLLKKLPIFMSHEMMISVLKRKLPEESTENIAKTAKYLADKIRNNKFKKVYLVISNLIEKKYGKEEKLDYVLAIIKGEAH